MYERMIDALLRYTGYPISALVSLGEGEKILDVRLFDTCWQAERMRIDPKADCILLISNHPYGQKTPYAQDFANAYSLRNMAGGRPVRLFLVSEYFPCREIAL